MSTMMTAVATPPMLGMILCNGFPALSLSVHALASGASTGRTIEGLLRPTVDASGFQLVAKKGPPTSTDDFSYPGIRDVRTLITQLAAPVDYCAASRTPRAVRFSDTTPPPTSYLTGLGLHVTRGQIVGGEDLYQLSIEDADGSRVAEARLAQFLGVERGIAAQYIAINGRRDGDGGQVFNMAAIRGSLLSALATAPRLVAWMEDRPVSAEAEFMASHVAREARRSEGQRGEGVGITPTWMNPRLEIAAFPASTGWTNENDQLRHAARMAAGSDIFLRIGLIPRPFTGQDRAVASGIALLATRIVDKINRP